jgi:hypothetical protein
MPFTLDIPTVRAEQQPRLIRVYFQESIFCNVSRSASNAVPAKWEPLLDRDGLLGIGQGYTITDAPPSQSVSDLHNPSHKASNLQLQTSGL